MVVYYFEVAHRYLCGGTEGQKKNNLDKVARSSRGRDLNTPPSGYEAGIYLPAP
jgi:hypothetical protein